MNNPTYLLFAIYILSSLSFLGRHPTAAVARNNSLSNEIVVDVGVILDFGSWLGNMSNNFISMAMSDLYDKQNYTTKLVLHWKDSKGGVVDAASAALELIKNVQAKAIIGPQTSDQAEFVAELGSKTKIPILSFSATSPFLSQSRTPYFIRTAVCDSSQVKAIAAIVEHFEWRQVVPIYEDSEYGNGIIPNLADALQDANARIPYRSVISCSATDDEIVAALNKLKTMETRVFIVHLSLALSSRLFLKANEIGMMNEGYVWIITSELTSLLDSMNSSIIQSMQGVLGVKPFIGETKELKDFKGRWAENLRVDKSEPNIFGLWAYDTIWALAKAVERIGAKRLGNLTRFGVSNMGVKLLDAVLHTNFRGLSGEFRLINGQLESSMIEIVNVIGRGERRIGFWTESQGIKDPKNKFKTIIWPGEGNTVPKGWEISATGKKLKIGVPKRPGFIEFVNVTSNQSFEGYCIDVFKAALGKLNYYVPYEFQSFQNENGSMNGSYNDLIYQVYLKKFDAVVGDTTIVYNRSLYVDFTLPFTESGVTMVVLADDRRSKTWIFLKPLNWKLWLATGAAFIFIGMVVWALEYRVNEEFRGPLDHQIGLVLWFAFSTLVFAHRERLVSNYTRFVVTIWVFVVLILSNSYTASLSSLLTVEQLQPAVNNVEDLIRNGGNVGYQKGAFVKEMLTKRFNIPEEKLKEYATPEEYGEALSNRSVGGIVDEIPYIRLFLAKKGNCAKYKMVGPIYKTDGFGFVFPKGSPLVPDISRAILNVTEGKEMEGIEKRWIGTETTCADQYTSTTSNSLTLDSFWGLFLITGAASILALSIYFSSFIYEHRHVLIAHDTGMSLGQRFIALFKLFKERDTSHYNFRSGKQNESLAMVVRRTANEAATITDAFEGPSTNSNLNRRASVTITEIANDAQHLQQFNGERQARRRWSMLRKAWLFRSRYIRLDGDN